MFCYLQLTLVSERYTLLLNCLVVNIMFRIVKCKIDMECPKCSSFSDAIVTESGQQKNLYCQKCGAYIKHPSKEDMRYAYITRVEVNDMTPILVISRMQTSEKTLAYKY